METLNLAKETLKSFIQEMHDWEVFCGEIDLDKDLSHEEQFHKQKEKLSELFKKYCTERDRKSGRPNVIHFGKNGYYEYDLNEEKIIEVTQESKSKIIIYTERENPMYQKFQYIIVNKKGEWLIDMKKKENFDKTKWENRSL